MIKLRLIKGLSYTSATISATAKDPYVTTEDEAAAQYAVASGYFEVVETEELVEAEEPQQMGGKLAEDMTVSELETYATYMGVSLKKTRTKAAIISKLKEELPDVDFESPLYYGSPTVVELQDTI